jgi:hypothetical protein
MRALPIGHYGLYQNGSLVGTRDVGESASLELPVDVAGEELNLVLVHEEHVQSLH